MKTNKQPHVEQSTEFPRRFITRAYGNRENNRLLGEYIGLEEEALNKFKTAFATVQFYISVYEDGKFSVDKIVTDGVDAVYRKPVTDDEVINWGEYQEFLG